ncbi:hypothetical protein ACFWPK_22500 [Nocardia sp. NPDC058519]|uniref:hypothetical protein n=1 Tax=Nocardia sp. NPDC058519 TaxID=3346535 RepID=UPI0036495B17
MAGPIRGGCYLASTAAAVAGSGQPAKKVPLDTLHTGFPYTLALSSNSLVVRGTGPIVIAAQCSMPSGATCTAQLRINGNTVATGGTALASSVGFVYLGARDGDLLTLWETDNGNGVVHKVASGPTVTFITYEVYGPGSRGSTTPAIQRASLY